MTKTALIIGVGVLEGVASDEGQVRKLVENCEMLCPCDLAIYNAGNNFSGECLNMGVDYFEEAWTPKLDLRTFKENF